MADITLHIDPAAIRIKHLRALGRAKDMDAIVAWMVEHAGAVESELDELTLAEMVETQKTVLTKLTEAAVPKVNGSS